MQSGFEDLPATVLLMLPCIKSAFTAAMVNFQLTFIMLTIMASSNFFADLQSK